MLREPKKSREQEIRFCSAVSQTLIGVNTHGEGGLRREAFAVGLVVAVPAAQGFVAGILEKKFQCGRFNVTIANPNGIVSCSPGLRGTSYPGLKMK